METWKTNLEEDVYKRQGVDYERAVSASNIGEMAILDNGSRYGAFIIYSRSCQVLKCAMVEIDVITAFYLYCSFGSAYPCLVFQFRFFRQPRYG